MNKIIFYNKRLQITDKVRHIIMKSQKQQSLTENNKVTKLYKYIVIKEKDNKDKDKDNKEIKAICKDYLELIPLIDNYKNDDGINGLDNETATKLKNQKFRIQFITTSVLLSEMRKMEMKERKLNKTNGTTITTSNHNESHEKTNKLLKLETFIDLVRENFIACTSLPVLSALAIFCTHTFDKNIRLNILYNVLNGNPEFNTVQKLIDIIEESCVNDTLKEKLSRQISVNNQYKKMIIHTCTLIADVRNERSYAKLAFAIDLLLYVKYFEKNNTMVKFGALEPLITEYVSKFVPPVEQNERKIKIRKEVQVNSVQIIETMVKSVRDFYLNKNKQLNEKKETANNIVSSSTNVKSKTSKKTQKLEDIQNNVEYTIYEGSLNFTSHLKLGTYKNGNISYVVETLHSCIFNVFGYTTQNVDNRNVSTIFIKEDWEKRLNMLKPFRTIVPLEKMMGYELKNYLMELDGAKSIYITWVDDLSLNSMIYQTKRKSQATQQNAEDDEDNNEFVLPEQKRKANLIRSNSTSSTLSSVIVE